MAGDGVNFSTTVDQYAREHHITNAEAIKILGLPQNVNQYQFFTFEEIPEGGYKTVESKTDTFNSDRTQGLKSDPFPENNPTYRLNQHIKNFKNADGFWEKTKVAADVFVTDWDNFPDFIVGTLF